jgi:hypothetical protein
MPDSLAADKLKNSIKTSFYNLLKVNAFREKKETFYLLNKKQKLFTRAKNNFVMWGIFVI